MAGATPVYAAATAGLLAVGVLGVLFHRGHLPSWTAAVVAVLVEIGTGLVHPGRLGPGLAPLGGALAFVCTAVPLASLLDRIGFFEHAARVGVGHRYTGVALWVLAGVVTAVLNLDAAVVLLTPLYIRIARTFGFSVESLAFQPVLLASLASSALPVSNLTNLIAVSKIPAPPGQFLAHLGLPTLAAVVVGYLMWRWRLPAGEARVKSTDQAEARPLVVGGGVVVAILAGFVWGPGVGVAPWMVAGVADLFLVGLTRSVPWRAVPLGTVTVAGALAVLAEVVAAHVALGGYFVGQGPLSEVRIAAISAVAAGVGNNLPAVLVALDALGGHGQAASLWPILLGVNIAPALVLTGALAGLLWRDTARGMGLEISARRYTAVGAVVGLPAFGAALAVLVLQGLA